MDDYSWKAQGAQDLYVRILQTANYFLREAQQFEIIILQGYDPSFEKLAYVMEQLAHIVYQSMIDLDPHFAQKAVDYSSYMRLMARAIVQGDKDELDRLTSELDKMSFA
ncbi:MAG: hypothetical protein OXC41_06905 [Gammaproteobacteria bacterium]|nr:hypothetical protein [Gammaproteobacteria bacterium]